MGTSLWLGVLCGDAAADELRRRADLGAVFRPPGAEGGAQVVRVEPDSRLAAAGLREGDEVIALDGRPLQGPIDFDRRLAALRGGDRIRVQVRRGGASIEIVAELDPLVRDRIPGTEVAYDAVTNPAGPRQRVILSRPAGGTGQLPAVLFIPWLSCDSVEVPKGPRGGIEQLLYHLAARSGMVLMRIDKPGVGDSEGVCADTDFDTELAGYRAALAALRAHPWVDASRIVIMGQSFSGGFLPLVADTTPVAGYVVINSWVRTWFERLIEFERLALERGSLAPGEVTERLRGLIELYTLILEQRKTPREAIAERPRLAGVWEDEPEHQYGRPAPFFHQLQALNLARAWETVDRPTLAIWGEADIVMHREDHERIVALVNGNRAGTARLVTVPGMSHGMLVNTPEGPRLPDEAVRAVDEFLSATLRP